ncbi:hypothetical protein [Bacillus suaedae]|uniref:YqfQ-like protein n=1 Tax=Halalkalibacter suaedae TaxID=2822140 RepID=A0A941ANF6_9BACI|nr:hypothetical protein [Bacillus suaedae]MBP3950277.1 hypothetical protein [Bacillus suaedae]
MLQLLQSLLKKKLPNNPPGNQSNMRGSLNPDHQRYIANSQSRNTSQRMMPNLSGQIGRSTPFTKGKQVNRMQNSNQLQQTRSALPLPSTTTSSKILGTLGNVQSIVKVVEESLPMIEKYSLVLPQLIKELKKDNSSKEQTKNQNEIDKMNSTRPSPQKVNNKTSRPKLYLASK